MIPSSIATGAAFLLLVAPGLLTDLLASKRRAGVPESTFRELSRTVLASLVFTSISALAIALISLILHPVSFEDVLRVFSQDKFPAEHRFALFVHLLTTSAAACLLAFAYDRWKFRGDTSHINASSGWFQVFQEERPESRNSYVRIRLNNGYTYMGSLVAYTPGFNFEQRELVLGGEIYITPPGGKRSRIPEEWERMVFRGVDISSISVRYDPAE
jgi:hypothetical protein